MTEVTPRLTAASVKFYWLNDLIGGAVDVTAAHSQGHSFDADRRYAGVSRSTRSRGESWPAALIAGEVQLGADPLQFVGIHFHGHAAHDQLQRKHNS
jgi:hypothetical protein